MFNVGDWLRRGWNDFVLGFDATRQRQLLRPLGLGDLPPARLVALFIGAAVLALLWMAWLTARDGREQDPILRAWRQLGRRYARIGLAGIAAFKAHCAFTVHGEGRGGSDAPINSPDLGPALHLLIVRFNSWRYARPRQDGSVASSLVRDLHRHRPTPAPRRAR